MKFFLKDINDNVSVSWDDLINDLASTDTYSPYCKTQSYYAVFKHIILSMLIGEEVILLDQDFTEDEINNLIGSINIPDTYTNIPPGSFSAFNDKEGLLKALSNTSPNWRITLFTSGTTGQPKKVSHSYTSISRFVRKTNDNDDVVWGFAYNPTHMAGVQVFLQALLNGNSIVRLFGLSPEVVLKEVKNNNITHISATPTFYKLLISTTDTFPSVKRITSGGEKLNEKILGKLTTIFFNSKITNVYASTEAGTLLASENDEFTIKTQFDKLIKIENNELLIHNSLLGNSEVLSEEWYNSGDIVEIISEEPLKFKFVSRKSEMINVGGYKVNPAEVEDALLAMDDVKDARVFAKKSSVLGNIICCEVVSETESLEESTIRLYLQSKLQEFKIPRIFKFVAQLETTRTGKIKRN